MLVNMEYTMQKTSTDIENEVSNALVLRNIKQQDSLIEGIILLQYVF
jgi:hypothetical protein